MTPPSSTTTSTFAVLGGVRTTLKRGSVVPLRPSAATRTALRQSRPQGPGDGPSPHRDVQRPEPTTLTGAQETQRPPGNSDRIRLLAHWWKPRFLSPFGLRKAFHQSRDKCPASRPAFFASTAAARLASLGVSPASSRLTKHLVGAGGQLDNAIRESDGSRLAMLLLGEAAIEPLGAAWRVRWLLPYRFGPKATCKCSSPFLLGGQRPRSDSLLSANRPLVVYFPTCRGVRIEVINRRP
jgi:hypothetical protein